MIELGLSLTNAISGLMGGASILALFASGEVGVWFEPNDITTLYQDINGTTPVTAPGQTCALMLDKSKGLVQGPQLADVNTQTLSQATGARSGAGWNLTATANFPTVAQPGTPITTGKLYRVAFAWSGNDELRTVAFNAGGVFIASLGATASGSVTRTVMATGTGTVQLYTSNAVAGDTLYLEITSVTEVQGNHAQQAAPAQRPTYGVVPYGGVRNLANGSGAVGDVAYFPTTITSNGITATKIASGTDIDGLPYADISIVGTASATSFYDIYAFANSRIAAVLGQTFTTSMLVKVISGALPPAGCGAVVGVVAETAPSTITENTVSAQFAPTVETGISFTATLANAASNQARLSAYIRTAPGATVNYTIRVKGLQFEKAAARSAFQLNLSKYNVTEAGKASLGVLYPDGIDDGMVTPSINFSGTDKMTVWAGLQKMSDAAQGIVTELSPTNSSPGMFNLQAPGPGVSYRFASGGSFPIAGIADAVGIAAPTANILTGIADISIDKAILQVNGVQVASSGNDQGTGNYGNYPLYLFRRGGASLPFNGIFTGLIVRGAASSAAQISNTNAFMNSELGAY